MGKRDLPETMICPATGVVQRRDIRPFTFSYKGVTRTVDLPGYYPDDDGESVHIGEDMAVTDAALAKMKAIADGPAAAAVE